MSLGANRPHAPACPLYSVANPLPSPPMPVTPCESDFKSVSRALRGIAIRLVVGPDPYYILATIPLTLTSPPRSNVAGP